MRGEWFVSLNNVKKVRQKVAKCCKLCDSVRRVRRRSNPSAWRKGISEAPKPFFEQQTRKFLHQWVGFLRLDPLSPEIAFLDTKVLQGK